LRRWFQLCGESGLYPRERLGFGLLVGTPEVMNGRSGVVACDTDDPLNFVIAYYGNDFKVYDGKSLVATRFCDLPDRDVAEVAVGCYMEAIKERKPIAHRMHATFGGVAVSYDRLILPTVNGENQIDRLVTVSRELTRSS
ncbi:MAG TPA: hypothetical protein VE631_07740, partial [Alphaproteobacteria bacterium]|nr:hypothetical protein [Alphaproteobacteria bacterium]